MKTAIRLIGICLLAFAASGCAGGGAVQTTEQVQEQPEYSADSLSLDTAIGDAALYFGSRLPSGAKVALVPFDAPAGSLSDYIFEELWSRFEDTGNFIMVDRRNLDRIESELHYQLASGRVDDNTAASITKQYGAEILVYGQIAAVGGEYRLSVYATDVERAASSQRAFMIRPDSRLSSLLAASPDDEIERAVSAMARAVNEKTVIAVGRISYADTGTVSGLSAWLKNGIIAAAQGEDKFEVASESESAAFAVKTRGLTLETPLVNSAIQAVVTGTYSPLDSGAEITIRLISSGGNKPVLSSSRFVIPASELERRKLTLLPEKDNTVITKAEFESKQKAIDPYAGRNNRWDFTVSSDDLDGVYYDGSYMSLQVYSARDCYFRIIHVSANGDAQVIYPVSPGDNNFIRAGETRVIPDNTRFRMGPPFGEEIILAAAYETSFTYDSSSGAVPLSADSISRGLTVESQSAGVRVISPAATARFSYTILPE